MGCCCVGAVVALLFPMQRVAGSNPVHNTVLGSDQSDFFVLCSHESEYCKPFSYLGGLSCTL